MASRPLGLIHDDREEAFIASLKHNAKHLLGAPVRLPSAASLGPYTPRPRFQFTSSGCVGFAFWRAIDTRLRSQGIDLGEHSPWGIYQLARLGDLINANEALTDMGSRPSVAVEQMAIRGVPHSSAWEKGDDLWGLAHVNDKPNLAELEDASSMCVSELFPILETGDSCAEAIYHAISEGHPVVIGIPVDEAMTNYSSGVVQRAGEKVLGLHALCVWGYDSDGNLDGNNSWDQWGLDTASTFKMSSACVKDDRMVFAYIVQLAPKPPKEQSTDVAPVAVDDGDPEVTPAESADPEPTP